MHFFCTNQSALSQQVSTQNKNADNIISMTDDVKKEKKTGLILEGGAMRALFSAGVTDVMLENGIVFDGAIGVSAGAAFGCNYKSKQNGRAIRYNLKYSHDYRYCSFFSLLTSGNLYNATFCYHTLPNDLDRFDFRTYKANPMEFYVVATDIQSGLPLYKKLEECNFTELEWMRASASMPLVSKPVELDNHKLLDGGITDSIPLQYFESLGYNRNIVILTQPRDFVKEKNKALPLLKLFLGKYPNLVRAMESRHTMYNDETSYIFAKADKKEVLVICPKVPLGISRTEKDRSKLRRVYEIGRNACVEKLPEIKEFLSQ